MSRRDPHAAIAHALAQERADRAAFGGVDIGRWDQVAAQQMGQLLRVDAVVLVLAAVNVGGVEGMGEHELDPGRLAGVSQPVPVEGALADHCQVVPVRLDPLEEVVEVVALDVGVQHNLALPVHETGVHLPGVEIDSAVVLGCRCVILHGASPLECC